MLDKIKERCGVPVAITVYDNEFTDLIADCIEDLRTAGVPENLLVTEGDVDPRVLTAVALYVQALRGSDRTDTDRYLTLYHRRVWKLMLEPTD